MESYLQTIGLITSIVNLVLIASLILMTRADRAEYAESVKATEDAQARLELFAIEEAKRLRALSMEVK